MQTCGQKKLIKFCISLSKSFCAVDYENPVRFCQFCCFFLSCTYEHIALSSEAIVFDFIVPSLMYFISLPFIQLSRFLPGGGHVGDGESSSNVVQYSMTTLDFILV